MDKHKFLTKGRKIAIREKLDSGIVKEYYATEIINEDGDVARLKSDE